MRCAAEPRGPARSGLEEPVAAILAVGVSGLPGVEVSPAFGEVNGWLPRRFNDLHLISFVTIFLKVCRIS